METICMRALSRRVAWSALILLLPAVLAAAEPCVVDPVKYAALFDVVPIDDGQGGQATAMLNHFAKKAYVVTAGDVASAVPNANTDLKQIMELRDAYLDDYEWVALAPPSDSRTVSLAVHETPILPFLELLGVTPAIDFVTEYASSPCVVSEVESGAQLMTVNFTDGTIGGLEAAPEDVIHLEGIGEGASSALGENDTIVRVAISEELREGSALASAEWIKFLAPLFGKECEANRAFAEIEERYNCHRDKATQVFSGAAAVEDEEQSGDFSDWVQPVVAVASRSDYGNTTFRINGANYLARYIRDAAGVNAVDALKLAGVEPDKDTGSIVFEDVELFKDALQSVDILIDNTFMTNATAEELLAGQYNISESEYEKYPFLTGRPALYRLDKRVSSLPAQGADWFESRYANVDVVLEDFIYAIHPSYKVRHLASPRHELTYLRDMLADEGSRDGEVQVLGADSCNANGGPSVLLADDCSLIVD